MASGYIQNHAFLFSVNESCPRNLSYRKVLPITSVETSFLNFDHLPLKMIHSVSHIQMTIMTRRKGLWLCETDEQFLPLKTMGPLCFPSVADQMID